MRQRLDAQDPGLAEEVQLRVVQTVRHSEKAGQVTIVRGDDRLCEFRKEALTLYPLA